VKWSDQTAMWQAKWHLQNWLDCIRTRERPVGDVEIGHRSISVCHLANITREVGRRLHWDPVHEHFVDDDEANEYVDQPHHRGLLRNLVHRGERRQTASVAAVANC